MCELGDDLADKVAKVTYQQYESLAKKGKPQTGKEWTLLSSIVMSYKSGDEFKLHVVAMGTGTKCLGKSSLSKAGDVINDSHAEIISRRGFLCYLYHQLELAYKGEYSRVFQPPNEHNRYCLRSDVKFHLFTSHTPCGDASIFPKSGSSDSISVEITKMQKRPHEDINVEKYCCKRRKLNPRKDNVKIKNDLQVNINEELDLSFHTTVKCADTKDMLNDKKDSFSTTNVAAWTDNSQALCSSVHSTRERNTVDLKTDAYVESKDIYRTGAKCVPGGIQDSHGSKTDYHSVGALRIKPGRGDRTICMSCSDKIARWTVVGIQGALLSHMLSEPLYLQSVIIAKGSFSYTATKRAIIDRVANVVNLPRCYKTSPPVILQSNLSFTHCKYTDNKLIPSSAAIIWYEDNLSGFCEVSVNGRKQGTTSKNSLKPESRCSICSVEIMRRFIKLVTSIEKLPLSLQNLEPNTSTYMQYKMAATEYQEAFQILKEKSFSTWIQKPREYLQFKVQ